MEILKQVRKHFIDAQEWFLPSGDYDGRLSLFETFKSALYTVKDLPDFSASFFGDEAHVSQANIDLPYISREMTVKKVRFGNFRLEAGYQNTNYTGHHSISAAGGVSVSPQQVLLWVRLNNGNQAYLYGQPDLPISLVSFKFRPDHYVLIEADVDPEWPDEHADTEMDRIDRLWFLGLPNRMELTNND